ncbi:MAG: Uma2 family endonuclease [Methylobacterium frigidaeris]
MVDQQSGHGSERATSTPIVVIEVLSASTDYDDHVARFARYRVTRYRVRPTLRQYVVFAQTEPRAFVWLKDDTGEWPKEPTVYESLNAVVPFPSVEAVVSLVDIDPPPRAAASALRPGRPLIRFPDDQFRMSYHQTLTIRLDTAAPARTGKTDAASAGGGLRTGP